MATYRLYPSTSGPGSATVDNGQYTMGLLFVVSSPGLSLQGWWHWVAGSGQATTAEDFALWTVTGSGMGAYIASSVVTSGVFTAGQWNFVSCASPITLTSGQEYMAVKTVNKAADGNNHYSGTSLYFQSGAGTNGITNGPLLAYSSGNAGNLGTSNRDPTAEGQMMFNAGGANATGLRPNNEFNATNYWLDVQVGTPAAAAPTVVYSMRSFP